MADTSALIQEPSAANATAEVDAESLGTGPQGKALRRERLQLAGRLLAQIADVLNAAPAGTEYALIVRPIPSTTAQPVSAASLPLPAGASTETTLALIKAKTDNLDVALSTRTKPGDTQPISAASLPLPAGASTEATLALIKAKTDNLDVLLSTRTKPSDTQPVSAAALPLPAGAATETTLGTRLADATVTARLGTLGQKAMAASAPVVLASDQASIPVSATLAAAADVSDRAARLLGHVVVDSVTADDVSDRAARILGHVVVDSAGAVSIVALPALPAGSNAIGSLTDPILGGAALSSSVALPDYLDLLDEANLGAADDEEGGDLWSDFFDSTPAAAMIGA